MQARFVHDGKAIDYTPVSDVAAGQVVVIGSLLAIAKIDIPAGRTGALHTVGVYDIAKGAVEISAGGKVFWDADGDPVDGVEGSGAAKAAAVGGNIFAGFALAPATEEDKTVRVLLIGSDDLGDIPVAAAVASPGALTYVVPSGGSTIDTEGRASLAQVAVDTAAIRTQLIAALTALKNAGLMASA